MPKRTLAAAVATDSTPSTTVPRAATKRMDAHIQPKKFYAEVLQDDLQRMVLMYLPRVGDLLALRSVVGKHRPAGSWTSSWIAQLLEAGEQSKENVLTWLEWTHAHIAHGNEREHEPYCSTITWLKCMMAACKSSLCTKFARYTPATVDSEMATRVSVAGPSTHEQRALVFTVDTYNVHFTLPACAGDSWVLWALHLQTPLLCSGCGLHVHATVGTSPRQHCASPYAHHFRWIEKLQHKMEGSARHRRINWAHVVMPREREIGHAPVPVASPWTNAELKCFLKTCMARLKAHSSAQYPPAFDIHQVFSQLVVNLCQCSTYALHFDQYTLLFKNYYLQRTAAEAINLCEVQATRTRAAMKHDRQGYFSLEPSMLHHTPRLTAFSRLLSLDAQLFSLCSTPVVAIGRASREAAVRLRNNVDMLLLTFSGCALERPEKHRLDLLAGGLSFPRYGDGDRHVEQSEEVLAALLAQCIRAHMPAKHDRRLLSSPAVTPLGLLASCASELALLSNRVRYQLGEHAPLNVAIDALCDAIRDAVPWSDTAYGLELFKYLFHVLRLDPNYLVADDALSSSLPYLLQRLRSEHCSEQMLDAIVQLFVDAGFMLFDVTQPYYPATHDDCEPVHSTHYSEARLRRALEPLHKSDQELQSLITCMTNEKAAVAACRRLQMRHAARELFLYNLEHAAHGNCAGNADDDEVLPLSPISLIGTEVIMPPIQCRTGRVPNKKDATQPCRQSRM